MACSRKPLASDSVHYRRGSLWRCGGTRPPPRREPIPAPPHAPCLSLSVGQLWKKFAVSFQDFLGPPAEVLSGGRAVAQGDAVVHPVAELFFGCPAVRAEPSSNMWCPGIRCRNRAPSLGRRERLARAESHGPTRERRPRHSAMRHTRAEYETGLGHAAVPPS